MGSKICMNGLCGTTTSAEWLKGWALKKGGFATLCSTCGPPYTRGTYCQRFHLNEPGWRQCKYCEQPIHCGCIVSTYTYDFLDMGGVACLPCINRKQQGLPRPHWISRDDIPNGFAGLGTFGNCQSSVLSNRINIASVSSGIPAHLNEVEKQKSCIPTPLCDNEPTSCTGQFKQEENMHTAGDYGMDLSSGKIEKEVGISFPSAEFGTIFPHLLKSIPSSIFPKPDYITPTLGLKDMNEALPQPSLSFSPLGTPNSLLPVSGGIVEGREQSKVPSFKQGQRTRHILPKPSKSGTSTRAQANKGMVSQNRVARPPAEGRGRNQLLPRYWPRITDQELEQISGDLNCTIVPLFEKVLSASDAGRIGRLVLPKACAEAYFPPISQSEGLPIRIQDIKGQEWTFQFRFWPNNNSRMYVLEGVTPCIQNMQLQAGDTVTFSRLEPGSKLVIGCRKAAASIDSQEAEPSALPNGLSGETSLPTPNENLTAKNEEHEGMTNGDPPVLNPEKKRTRNIGSKSKRLLMHSEDAMELRVTWEEAQELLRPASSSKPNVIVIENQEFEEYDEPPVFGKRTIFTEQTSGSQEQWGQCDSCSKWRKIPVDVLLPPKWSCSDNVWDPNRSSCSAPDEINTRDLERISRTGKELKRRRMAERRVSDEIEPTGLDALATAAVLGDATGGGSGESSVGPTTRHPRHRPGCTCIVCIQPPSGKGKHKPTCICNVCLTVKRRFKTLMLRKKKRQAELAQGKENQNEEDLSASVAPLHNNELSIGMNNLLENGREMEAGESSSGKGQVLDLNCDPNSNRDEEMITLAEAEGMTMAFTSLVRVADLPIRWPYNIGQSSGLSNLVPCENEGQPSDDNPGDEES